MAEIEPPTQVAKGIERLLSVQRPLVIAHVRSIRKRHPEATPAEVIRVLERRYLAAVTSGGAAVGASAVIPGVGVGVSLALSGVETAGFLEASALFAQSVTEVHGIAVEDPDRARTLVMALMLGTGGSDLVKQLAGQAAGKGVTRSGFWGEMVTKNLPKAAVGQIGDKIKGAFIRRFVTQQGSTIIGRAVPFGIGAVIGGTGNNILGRRVISSSHDAFGDPPTAFPLVLEPGSTADGGRPARGRFLSRGRREVRATAADEYGTDDARTGDAGTGDAGTGDAGVSRDAGASRDAEVETPEARGV